MQRGAAVVPCLPWLPGPGRSGAALPATRWARLRAHRIALNLDSSVPRRFSPAAYSSWTDRGEDGHAMQAHPDTRSRSPTGAGQRLRAPQAQRGTEQGQCPCCAPFTVQNRTPSARPFPGNITDPEAGDSDPGEPRPTGARMGQELL